MESGRLARDWFVAEAITSLLAVEVIALRRMHSRAASVTR
jgi:hypothetical protein